MTHPPAPHAPIAVGRSAPDLGELLRQSLAGLAPNDLLSGLLDRVEGRA